MVPPFQDKLMWTIPIQLDSCASLSFTHPGYSVALEVLRKIALVVSASGYVYAKDTFFLAQKELFTAAGISSQWGKD